MGRLKEKPDLDNAGVNPFSESLQILMSNNTTHVKNRFGEDDKIVANYESVRYTKVFDQTGVKALVASLSIRAKELYLHIMYSLESGEDILWIHRGRYMGMYGIRSVNTYKDSVKDLAEKGFIYPHVSLKDVYWINPHYFFKGDRRMKYPNRVKIVKRMNF